MDVLAVRLRSGLDRTTFIRRIAPSMPGSLLDEYILERIERGDAIPEYRKRAVEYAIGQVFPELVQTLEGGLGISNVFDTLDPTLPVRELGHASSRAPMPKKDVRVALEKRALLVGIDRYKNLGRLSYAKKDAEDFGNLLQEKCGFDRHEIDLVTCSSEGDAAATTRQVRQRIADLQSSYRIDFFLFGFWGHGVMRRDKKLYLTGVDTDWPDIEPKSVRFDTLLMDIKALSSKKTLMILDCCQSPVEDGRGTASSDHYFEESIRSAASQFVREPRDSIEKRRPSTTAILTSCRCGEVAYECDRLRNGYFTAQILGAITSGLSRVTDIADFVSRETSAAVMRDTGKQQSPWLELRGTGDIDLQFC